MESCCSRSVQRTNLTNSAEEVMSCLCEASSETGGCIIDQGLLVLKNKSFHQKYTERETDSTIESAKSAELPGIKDISPAQAHELIQRNGYSPDFVILDVRTEKEYNNGHLENAVLMNFFSTQFKEQLNRLDRNRTYLVYCKMGGRSKMAQKRMEKLGFKRVYNVSGGKDRWIGEEIPFGSGLQRFPDGYFIPSLQR